MVNLDVIVNNISTVLVAICAMCIMISVITEFTKEIGFLKKIPTNLQVLVLSIIVCTVAFFAVISYMNIAFVWYHLVAVIFLSFIVAIITAKGWEYFIDIIKRYWKKKSDFK